MADPVSVSISLANMHGVLQTLKAYQRNSGDLTLQSFITSLQATYNSNIATTPTAPGMSSIVAQSADGLTGSGN